MATFDVLAGRLTIDNAGFLSGLQAASAAAQRFADGLNRTMRTAQDGIERLTNSIGALKSTASSKALFEGVQRSAASAEKATARLGEALDGTRTRIRGVQRAASDLGGNPAAARTLRQLEERARSAAGAMSALKGRIDGVSEASKHMPSAAPRRESEEKPDSSRLARDLETSNRALESAGKAFGLLEKITARASTWLHKAGTSIQQSTRFQEALAAIGISATSASERMEQLSGVMEAFSGVSGGAATAAEWMLSAVQILAPAVLALAAAFTTAGGAAALFETIASPLLTVVLPVAAAVGAITVALGTLMAAIAVIVVSIKGAIERSEAAQASWESIKDTFGRIGDRIKEFINDALKILSDWWEKNSEQIERIQEKVGELALKIGDKLASAMERIVENGLPLLKKALEGIGDAAGATLEGFETIVDLMNGDYTRSIIAANRVTIELNKVLISVLETLAEIPAKFGGFLGATLTDGIRKKILELKAENNLRELAQNKLKDLKQQEDDQRANERAQLAAMKNFVSGAVSTAASLVRSGFTRLRNSDAGKRIGHVVGQVGDALGATGSVLKGALFGGGSGNVDQKAAEDFGRAAEKGRVGFQQSNASAVAQADSSVSKAQETTSPMQKNPGDLFSNLLEGGASNVKSGLAIESANQKANFAMVANATGANASNPGMQALRAFGQQIMQQISMVAKLDGDAKQQQIQVVEQMRTAFAGLVAGVVNGKTKLSDMAGAVEKATKNIKGLDEAEQQRAAHAKGQLTPQEQQMQQAAQQFQQQFAQQIQQQWQNAAQQMGQQAWDSGQAMLEQALGGPGQVQEMIDQAAASGDMKTAIALIRQRLEAQLSQSKINLHNLASDPMAGGGFGSAHGGVSNDAYFMTLDIPLVRLIKFLQAQLDHLPKMEAGGIVSGATAAIVGEAGPEAVLPLTNFGNMLGALPVFQGIQTAMEKIGDYFSGLGNVGMAKRYFANLDKIQSVFDYATDRLDNAHRLDFMPASMQGGLGPSGGAAGAIGIGIGGRMAYATGAAAAHFSGPLNLHFHGVDITKPGAASAFAQQLLPALDAEARRAGVDMMGPSMLRSGGATTANRAYGYSR